MATAQEIRGQVSQAREQIAQARQTNLQARQNIETYKRELISQSALRRGGGIASLSQRRESLGQVGVAESVIQAREQQVQEYETDVERAERQVREYDQLQRDIKKAEQAAESKFGGLILENERQKKLYRQIKARQKAAIASAISEVESKLNMSLSQKAREQIASQIKNNQSISLPQQTIPTQTEQSLNMSLLPGLRELPSQDIQRRMSVEKNLPQNITQVNQFEPTPIQEISLPYQQRGTGILRDGVYVAEKTRVPISQNKQGFIEFITETPRAVGGAVEYFLEKNLPQVEGKMRKVEYEPELIELSKKLAAPLSKYELPEQKYQMSFGKSIYPEYVEDRGFLGFARDIAPRAGNIATQSLFFTSSYTAPIIVPAFAYKGVKEIQRGEYLQGALDIAPLGVWSGIKAGRFLFKPITRIEKGGVIREVIETPEGSLIVEKILPSTSKATAQDVVFPIINPKTQEIFGAGVFKLTVQQPAEYATIGSRFKRFFFEPEKILIRKGRTDITVPNRLIVTDASGKIVDLVFTGTKRQGSNLLKVSRYEGQQIGITPEEFIKLSSTQQRTLQRLAELKTGGTPVALRNVPDILGKEIPYSTGGLQTTKFFRANLKAGTRRLYREGTRVSRSELVSYAKPIYSTEELQVFETVTGVKSSIKTQPRATGRIDVIEGVSKVYKKPLNEVPSATEFIVPSKVSQKQVVNLNKVQNIIQKIQADVLKNIPKNKLTKAGKQILTPTQETESLPLLVGGTGTVSEFAGRGTYERDISMPVNIPSVFDKSILIDKQEDAQIFNQPQATVSSLKLKESNILKVSPTETTREFEILKTPQTQSPVLELLQKIVQEQKSRQKIIQTPTETTKRPPTPTPTGNLKVDISDKVTKRGQNIIGKLRQAYKVVTFRGGKPVTIAKNLPLGKAKRFGVKETLKTLRASFKLEPTGTTLEEDIDFEVPKSLFRPGKRDSKLYVQELTTRLKAKTETSEILKIRRSKQKKIRWL